MGSARDGNGERGIQRMDASILRSKRLVLSAPTLADVDLIAEYCRDPLFERFVTTPWPYTRRDARRFVERYVPAGWLDGTEYTWAVRPGFGGELLGILGYRVEPAEVGFWLGAPNRGHGYMSEAVFALIEWLDSGVAVCPERIHWACVEQNLASAAVARATGFEFDGFEERDQRGVPTRHWAGSRAVHPAAVSAAASAAALATWPAWTSPRK